ncbi:MAG: CHAT domain-containing protein [Phycisphaerales bacterium]
MIPAASNPATPAEPADALAAAERIKALAITDVRAALELAERTLGGDQEVRPRVRLLAARAHALCYVNDFEGATRDLDEAAMLAVEADLLDELGPLHLVRVQPLARAGRLDEAEEAAAAACAALSAPEQAALRGKAEVNLGIVRRMKGHAAESIACFERAAELLAGDRQALAAVHSNRAVALLELDQFDRASEAFQSAMSLLRESGRAHASAIVTGNVADLLARTGRIDAALARFDEARRLFEANGASADAARLTAEEAEALFSAGAFVKSNRLLAEAMPDLERAGLVRELARARLVQGLSALRLGNLAAARVSLDAAIDRARAANSPLITAEAHIGLAELCSAEGRADDARRNIRSAVELLTDRPVRQAAAMLALAGIELAACRPGPSLEAIDRAQARLGADAPGPLRARALHLRALAARLLGHHSEALSTLAAAVRVVEGFRASIRAEQVRTAYLESSQQIFLDTAAAALDALPEPEASPIVFDAVERIRGRCLLDAVQGSDASALALSDGTGDAELAELNALYASLGPTAADGSPDVERRRARLRALEAAREARADRAGSTRGDRSISIDPLPLSEAIGLIPPSQAVVSFFPDGPWISAQVLRRGTAATTRRLIERNRLGALCRRFRLALGRGLAGLDPDAGAAALPLADIRRAIVTPLEPSLRGIEHLRFMPFGELHGVPLHAPLPTDHGPATPGDDRIESYLPGLSVAHSLAAAARSFAPSGRAAVIGFADDLAPEIETEAREAAAFYPRAVSLIGREARADAAFEAIASADLVHVACHAVFDPDFPMSSRLRLADRWVSARELIGRVRPGAAVILAGCDTGRTQASAGEERLGLVWGSLASGACAVLAAAWPLHDSAARRALVRVHRGLARSTEPFAPRLAAELRSAQLELARAGEPLSRWANLFVSGALV